MGPLILSYRIRTFRLTYYKNVVRTAKGGIISKDSIYIYIANFFAQDQYSYDQGRSIFLQVAESMYFYYQL